jgi:hypothetical protein
VREGDVVAGEKYVIFKADEWDAAVVEGVEVEVPDAVTLPEPVEGFVLRPSDIFGPAALWGYAHLLQTAVELGQMRQCFGDDEYRRLVDSAVEVAKIAEDWQRRGENRKVPD